jgi:fluoride exporter
MFEWKQIMMVALGGALGSVARYKLGGVVLHHSQTWNFPLSTFCVNVLGCVVIGLLAAIVEHHDLFSIQARLFLFTGLLGGFTTFSAFGYETMFLLRRGLFSTSILYAGLSVVCGLAAVLIGFKTIELLWPTRH